MKKQTQLWKTYERTGRSKEYEEYKKQRNKNNQMRKTAKREYEKKLLKRLRQTEDILQLCEKQTESKTGNTPVKYGSGYNDIKR